MREFFTSKKFIIILCICAVFIGVMIYSAVSSTTVLSSGLGVFFAPVQSVTNSVSSWISSRFDMLFHAEEYYNENKLLKEQLGEMANKIIDYTETKQENEHLREMLGLKEQNQGIEFSEPCTVIGRTANDECGSFFIDKGSRDGIEYYDPVVTANGLIGFVTEVQYTYSKVTTILAPDISIGVYGVENGETGVTQGSYLLARDNSLEMIYIPLNSSFKNGDIIITSGYSGRVPKGLAVGTVLSLEIASNGLSQNAVISPIVDHAELKTVYVITDFDGKGSGYDH